MSKALWFVVIGGILAGIYGLVELFKRVSLFDIAVWIFIIAVMLILGVAVLVIINKGQRVSH